MTGGFHEALDKQICIIKELLAQPLDRGKRVFRLGRVMRSKRAIPPPPAVLLSISG